MSATMDAAGRIVVPKNVRDAAGFPPGVPLDVRFRDGRIEIEPAPVRVRLEARGGVMVLVPTEPVPVLTAAEVDAAIASVRDERA